MTPTSTPRISSPSIAKLSFVDLTKLLPLVIKRSGALLALLYFAREASLQLLNYFGVLLQASGREEMATLVGLAALNFFFEILGSAIWSFVLISATRAALRQELLWSKRSVRDFNQLLIEGVRSMAQIFWRLPFAVIPGVVELLRLLFVPHVVLLEPLYERGQIDALARSRQAVKAKWLLILVITLVSLALSAGVDAVAQAGNDTPYFWQEPARFFLSAVLTLAISLVYEVYLVAVFLRVNIRFP